MSDLQKLLNEADLYQTKKVNLDLYKDVIVKLRRKGASWREIASFLEEKADIRVEHTKISRTAASWGLEKDLNHEIPSTEQYLAALRSITISEDEYTMLVFHYNQPNRTVTYTGLSESVGRDTHHYANKVYGNLAKKLAEELAFKPFPSASNRPFYGSVIGMKYAYAGPNDEFQLVLHHSLSDAIRIWQDRK